MARKPAITRAISIRQPWAHLILKGIKRKEYRTVPTAIRERVWIYAGLRPASSPTDWKKAGKSPGGLPAGKIVGSVEVTGCRWNQAKGVYQYQLAKPKRLARPKTATNQPGPVFWRPQF